MKIRKGDFFVGSSVVWFWLNKSTNGGFTKLLGFIVLFTRLSVSAQYLEPGPSSPSLSCWGPGFDYSELDVSVDGKRINVRLAHYFRGLAESLQELGISLQADVREVRLSFTTDECVAIKDLPELIRYKNITERKSAY